MVRTFSSLNHLIYYYRYVTLPFQFCMRTRASYSLSRPDGRGMTIERFIRLNNVGRFRRSSSNGDVSFRRYTLFYGENGRGKTTLCAVLRSLKTGDSALVQGRRTLGSAEAPAIEIRHLTGNLSFGPRGWSRTLPEIAVFDSTFVSQNVHSGDAIEPDHKRNLHKVIIGVEGVELATKIERSEDVV